MTDQDRPHPDSSPGNDARPTGTPPAVSADKRSDIEQAVEARSDAVARGEGGPEPMGAGGEGGAGGVVKNQDYGED